MRISDWSSEVCSSDLLAGRRATQLVVVAEVGVAEPLRRAGAAFAAKRLRGCVDGGRGRGGGKRFAAVEAGVVGPGVHCVSSAGPRCAACWPRGRRPRRRQVPASSPSCRFQSRSEEQTSELQSLMRISYAVFCLTKK